MLSCIVLSDSHGRLKNIQKVRPLFLENGMVIHLGDGSSDIRDFAREYPEKAIVIKGNCDFSYGMEEYVLEAGGVRVFCCHGHKYGVKSGLERLIARAKELDCTVALYGHTHHAFNETVDGVLCVNPGSAGDYTSPSYCYLALHNGKATAVIVNL